MIYYNYHKCCNIFRLRFLSFELNTKNYFAIIKNRFDFVSCALTFISSSFKLLFINQSLQSVLFDYVVKVVQTFLCVLSRIDCYAGKYLYFSQTLLRHSRQLISRKGYKIAYSFYFLCELPLTSLT